MSKDAPVWRPLVDTAIARLNASHRTFTEEEALREVWDAGYEVSPLDDPRFVLAAEAAGKHPHHWRLSTQALAKKTACSMRCALARGMAARSTRNWPDWARKTARTMSSAQWTPVLRACAMAPIAWLMRSQTSRCPLRLRRRWMRLARRC